MARTDDGRSISMSQMRAGNLLLIARRSGRGKMIDDDHISGMQMEYGEQERHGITRRAARRAFERGCPEYSSWRDKIQRQE